MIVIYFLLVAIVCYLIYKASDIFEEATSYLGRNMSNGVRGASLNAIASSMPELLTSFIFLFTLTDPVTGYAGTIGTTAGSAVFNALIIPALVIIFVYKWRVVNKHQAIPLSQYVLSRDGLFLIISEALLLITIATGEITWLDGLLLMLVYVVYSMVLVRDSKKSNPHSNIINFQDNINIPGTSRQFWISIRKLIISVVLMTVLCYALVHSVEAIGVLLNINLLFTSVILAAAASSVPDLMISIKDAKAGNYDDAIANALGSNIFDICIAHGLPLFIYTLMYGSFKLNGDNSKESNILRIVLLILTIISIFVYKRKGGVNKTSGYILLGLYAVFLGVVISRILN